THRRGDAGHRCVGLAARGVHVARVHAWLLPGCGAVHADHGFAERSSGAGSRGLVQGRSDSSRDPRRPGRRGGAPGTRGLLGGRGLVRPPAGAGPPFASVGPPRLPPPGEAGYAPSRDAPRPLPPPHPPAPTPAPAPPPLP